jgi:hypothetical protein
MLYQYFIQIVPTIVRTRFLTYKTFQYSVRELEREIDHGKGSHGISGIFFKYDMSGLKVEVTEESYSFTKFLVRLCAIVGGVYATVGMVYNHLSFFGRLVKCFRCSRENNIHSSSISSSFASTSDPFIPREKANSHTRKLSESKRPSGNLGLAFQSPVIDLVQPQLVSGASLNEPQVRLVPLTDGKPLPVPDILSSHSS